MISLLHVVTVVVAALAGVGAIDSAHANDDFGINLLSADTMTAAVLSQMWKSLGDLREGTDSGTVGSMVWITSPAPYKCRHDVFTYRPLRQTLPDGRLQESVEFSRCGQSVTSIILTRGGAGVTPLSDDDLVRLRLPFPSQSESYDLEFVWAGVKIHSDRVAQGTQALITIKLGSVDLRSSILDLQSDPLDSVHDRTYSVTYYSSSNHQEGVLHARRRIEAPGEAPSYDYDATYNSKVYRPARLGTFQAIYRPIVEYTVLGLMMGMIANVPPLFPRIDVSQIQ